MPFCPKPIKNRPLPNKNEKTSDKVRRTYSDLGRYSGMALKMAVVITAGFVGGHYLDSYLGFVKIPLLTLVLGFIGLGMSIYIIILDTRKK